RVRVTNVRADDGARSVSAQIEEIPTPGFPGFVGRVAREPASGVRAPLRWTIASGALSSFSDHEWSMGYGGWSLFFGADVVRRVVELASGFGEEVAAYDRYKRILHCVYE